MIAELSMNSRQGGAIPVGRRSCLAAVASAEVGGAAIAQRPCGSAEASPYPQRFVVPMHAQMRMEVSREPCHEGRDGFHPVRPDSERFVRRWTPSLRSSRAAAWQVWKASLPSWSGGLSRAAGISALLVLLAGCSAEKYERSADTEVYAAIAQKTPLVPNMDPDYALEEQPAFDLSSFAVTEQEVEFFGAEKGSEVGARILNLTNALAIAVEHNRQYQNEKESLYLQALSLTLSRHRYTPIFTAGGGVGYQERSEVVEYPQTGVEEVIKSRDVRVDANAGVSMLLRTGGRLTADFTTDFLRYLIGDRTLPTSSALLGTLTQPLLKGAGYKATMETLTQAERNLLYALREFTRFRKQFTVDLVTEYFRVLQDRDRVRNAWQAYQNFQASVRREHARFEEGLARKADLAELQESELTNEQAWINALRTYAEDLDRFKILLGLPTDLAIILDDRDLETLTIDETHSNLSLNEAVEVALASRLDLQIQEDQLEDAERRVDVAANGLLPQVDLVLSGRMNGRPGGESLNLDPRDYVWNAGVDFELPFDKKEDRNNYRAALIDFERARRQLDNATEEIRLQIQNGWRNLEQAKRDYEISQLRVNLSESRVREQELLSEIGEGDAFELVRSQDSLTGSRNELTSALINHTVIRLGFWRDLGLLYISQAGQWEEVDYAQDNHN